MECLAMDILGPFPLPLQGNKFLWLLPPFRGGSRHYVTMLCERCKSVNLHRKPTLFVWNGLSSVIDHQNLGCCPILRLNLSHLVLAAVPFEAMKF